MLNYDEKRRAHVAAEIRCRARRRGPAGGRCESQWPVDVACLASRRHAHALVQARQRAQQHAFLFAHADWQPFCSMSMFIAEQSLLACSTHNQRAHTTRATPPFSRSQNACRRPTCSTFCSCNCSPAPSAIRTGVCSTQPDASAAATRMHGRGRAVARARQAARCQDPHRRAPLQPLQPMTPQ